MANLRAIQAEVRVKKAQDKLVAKKVKEPRVPKTNKKRNKKKKVKDWDDGFE